MDGVYLKERLQDHIKATLDFVDGGGVINDSGLILELCDVMLTMGLCLRNHAPDAQGKALKLCAKALHGRIKYPALRVLLKRMTLPFILATGGFNELEHLMEKCISGTEQQLRKASEEVVQHPEKYLEQQTDSGVQGADLPSLDGQSEYEAMFGF